MKLRAFPVFQTTGVQGSDCFSVLFFISCLFQFSFHPFTCVFIVLFCVCFGFFLFLFLFVWFFFFFFFRKPVPVLQITSMLDKNVIPWWPDRQWGSKQGTRSSGVFLALNNVLYYNTGLCLELNCVLLLLCWSVEDAIFTIYFLNRCKISLQIKFEIGNLECCTCFCCTMNGS